MRLVFLLIFLILNCHSIDKQTEEQELRGVWLTNVDSNVLDSRQSIQEAMQFLADHHFNIVFPVVWNDAKTLYPSQVMDSLFGMPIDPRQQGRDPLQELIEEAHPRGIAVIPWFEYGFSASHKKNGGMILKKFPHWAAKDNQGRLLAKNGFEWMNAYHPEVQRFITSLVKEVVANYDVDGVQGDDRLPAQPIEGGYSAYTDSLYRAEHKGNPPPQNYRDPEWQRWRANRLNAYAKQLADDVRKIKPDVIISWAPSIYPWSYHEYLQDWPTWIKGGYADLIIPQVYRYDIKKYHSTLKSLSPDSIGLTPVKNTLYPGILMNVGDYVIPSEFLLKSIAHNRKEGFQGEVFFFYEGLRKNNDRLAKELLNSFYKEKAVLPFKTRQP